MILVDTSIWIDHLRAGDDRLARLLDEGRVVAHPLVTGELALGNLRHRGAVLGALQDLPQACVATGTEVLRFIGEKGFFSVSALATLMHTFWRRHFSHRVHGAGHETSAYLRQAPDWASPPTQHINGTDE